MFLQFYRKHPAAIAPVQAYEDAAGYDLHALCLTESGAESVLYVLPRATKAIPTGLVLLAPPGHYLTCCSRSGLALHDPPIFVANAPGIIDPDYTGEIKVILYNGGLETYQVRHGERIAQVLINPLVRCTAVRLDELPEMAEGRRGDRGFGSSGR